MSMKPPSATIVVDRLNHGDLAAAVAIQAEAYPPFLRESAGAFASRLDLARSYCLAARQDKVLVAYLIAHGWPGQQPPPVDTVLVAEEPIEVLFIHDLAVTRAGRGLAIGRRMIAGAFELAAREGLHRAELIAVEGAAPYWRSLGFAAAAMPPRLARQVAGYGPDARWMEREF